jgi:Ser/Thr protein kinase RdoA (MazF antagonist)
MTRLSDMDAVALARSLYDLPATARELPSERDQNFRLDSARGAFVLKVSGAAETTEALDLQNRALAWLAARAPELALPRLVPTAAGAPVAEAGGRFVRLLTYLPGTILADAKPRTPALAAAAGQFLGRLDAALEGFAHPAAVGRDLVWNPERAFAVIARHKDAIQGADRRGLVGSLAERHLGILAALAPRLRRGVIHNDANDYNVLVGDPAPAGRQIAGLVDFGDMLETWTVCEPAVAIAYAIFGHADPLAVACALTAGYDEVRALSDIELEALWSLVAIRLCTSVCLSAHRRTAEPDNEYLMVSEAPAWEALERIASVHPRLAHYRLRAACGQTPCPQTPAIEAWLRTHRSEIGPVVAGGLPNAVVFDLSAGSPAFASPEETTDTAAMTAKLFGAMRRKAADLGVGRYDEARLLYTSAAFAGSGGEHPERRTVHIAIDLFMEPGSPVTAPIAGRVHSLRDNAARLDYGPTVILEHTAHDAPPFYTLYGHLTRGSTARLVAGASIARGDRVGTIGPPPENGDWPPHVHFQVIADMLDMRGDFPGVAAASERETWLSLCPDANLVLRGPERFRAEREEPGPLAALRQRRLGPSLSLSYRAPLSIVRGFGAFLYDHTARPYLDMVNNVAHVGHCHPRVVRAGARQMGVLNTNTRYLHPSILRYADRLAATLPEPLAVCFFVCSGSEANELALRMARAATGGSDVLVVEGAYHGNTQTLVDVSPYKHDGPGGRGAPSWVHAVPMPDDYRGLYRRDDPDRGARFAGHVRDAAGRIASRGAKPAASPRPTATRAQPARSASPTRCRSGSGASGRASGDSRPRASYPTSSRWASRSATAIPSGPS